jgi:hypothetical protein
MKTWFLILWLLWPDGTMEKGEHGPFHSLSACQEFRRVELQINNAARPLRAECEEER